MPKTIKYQEEKWSNDENEIMDNETQQKSKSKKLALWLVVLGLIALAVWALAYFDVLPDKNGYQAVFLNNGQVYFGKLSRESSQYPILKDIYYLQISQPPLQGGEGTTPENSGANINLVKLGGELHGPQDEMRINRDSILFIEKLKSDSTVVQNIAKLKEQGR